MNQEQGHRERLRTKIIKNGPSSLHDYELLEAILFPLIPRKDTKKIAKTILKDFKNLWILFLSSYEELHQHPLISKNVALHICVIGGAIKSMNKSKIMHKKILSHWDDILHFIKIEFFSLEKEYFGVIFTDNQSCLIECKKLSHGTIDKIQIYPREIIKEAIKLNSSGIILIHNHPSGYCHPSKSDIETTYNMLSICQYLDITLYDHIIVGHNDYYSFKKKGIL